MRGSGSVGGTIGFEERKSPLHINAYDDDALLSQFVRTNVFFFTNFLLPFPFTSNISGHRPSALAVVVTFRLDSSLSRVAIPITKSIISSSDTTTYPAKHFRSRFRNYYSNSDPTFSDSDDNGDYSDASESETIFDDGGGLSIQIEKLGNNSRRIYSRICIDAPLQAVWNILTDYERLADFIPGLALSQLLFKIGNHARLFQVVFYSSSFTLFPSLCS